MQDLLRVICARDGVFLRREAEALGYSQVAMARMVRQGVWRRVRRGAYTFSDIWSGLDESDRYALLTRSAYKQAQTDVVLSHVSAVPEYDGPLWGLDLDTVHLTRRDGRTGRKERGVQQHRGLVMPGDVVNRNGVDVMSPTRTALEVTTVASSEAALCVVNDLLHRGLTTHEELRDRFAPMDRWPNTLATDLVLRLADSRIESVGETRTFHVCWRHGLPAPEPQYEVFDHTGTLIGRVDFAWPEHGVFLEFDGKVKYGKLLREGETPTEVVVREKRREERICEVTGWRCIRVTWADLMQPDILAARIHNMLFPGAGVA
ncbi:MAG TPA: type IV toxin-antitoxin system AbiEi family antitoxin domain-containing protein [Nocardioides sp.]|nr:type IV toxin-antitoxin system AbiEi family antitoxin domain-containing protein [Nocardioides sp.]